MRLSENSIVAEKYEIISPIGAGGMGTVYRARQLTMNRDVAVKFLNVVGGDAEAVGRFQREARILSTLKHRNLLACYEFGIWDGHYYVAMEYAPGVSLEAVVEGSEKGRLDGRKVVAIAKQVADALHCAHANGVIHRDLKPSNILLLDDTVKVIDFGLAKVVAAGNMQKLTETGYAVGSILYMSPEQCTGQRIDERADFYGLGAVMFYCLTGQPPFDADNPILVMQHHMHSPAPKVTEVVPAQDVPFGLDTIIDKCLAKNPDDRFQSAQELIQALDAVAFDKTAVPVSGTGASSRKYQAAQVPALLSAIPSGRSMNTGAGKSRKFVVGWIAFLAIAAIAAIVTPIVMGKLGQSKPEDPLALGYQMIAQHGDYQLAAPYFEQVLTDSSFPLSPPDRKMLLINMAIAKYERGEKKHSDKFMNEASGVRAWIADSTHISPQHAFLGSSHIPMTDTVLLNALSQYMLSQKTFRQVKEMTVIGLNRGKSWTPAEFQLLQYVYGYSSIQLGDDDEAIASFEALKNFKRDLPNMTARLEQGDAYLAAGRGDATLAAYKEVRDRAMKKELILEAKDKIARIESGTLKAERHASSAQQAVGNWRRYWESLDILHYEK